MKKIFLLSIGLIFFVTVYSQTLLQKLNSERYIACAHRANISNAFNENSLSSLKATTKAGIQMCEIDLIESSDGTLYIMHDRLLDRTTNCKGLFKNYSSKQINKIRLNKNDEHIPTFKRFLQFAKAHSLYLMLDVKDAPLEKIISLVEKYKMLDNVVVLTFSETKAREAFDMNKKFLVSVLVTKDTELKNYIGMNKNNQPMAVYVNQTASIHLFEAVNRFNFPIITDVLGKTDEEANSKGENVYADFMEGKNIKMIVSNNSLILLKMETLPR